MIYCVVPQELVDELYDKLVAYYASNPDVSVIVDRRRGPDRRNVNGSAGTDERRVTRDRRRARVTGTFPSVEVSASG
ncbi:MAG TPA: hypothetical protein VLJ76_04490 [Gaiellaceae bacterium]|nr:hypothetical protein [Gaiellaceae bacterium]